MTPVCCQCGTVMRCNKNERGFLSSYEDSNGDKHPYQLWATDEYKCPDCGILILTGFARRPMTEHYKEGFEEYVHDWSMRNGVIREGVKHGDKD